MQTFNTRMHLSSKYSRQATVSLFNLNVLINKDCGINKHLIGEGFQIKVTPAWCLPLCAETQ